MQVFLEAIQFNHDPDSATTDAFNIRQNETEFVTIPEWQRTIAPPRHNYPAAYALSETRGNTITIKAKFQCSDPGAKIQVRAINARVLVRKTLGCSPLGLFSNLVSTNAPNLSRNVLGDVKKKLVTFNADGNSDWQLFELKNVQLWSAGVSVSTTRWRWQFRLASSNHWTDFAITNHRIYTVLELPNCPWQQQPFVDANKQLPWADALEYACDWAASAQDPDEAATQITHSINDLGLDRVIYSGVQSYSCPNFNCTQFLDLLGGGPGMGQTLNCSDCATAVSSFANLVGCDLRQLGLGPEDIETKTIKLIGFPRESPDDFLGHEVAWKGGISEEGRLFDACLQVDGDDDPESPPFVALLPTNIRLGNTNDKEYRFRLSPELFLKPDTLGCRKIGYSVPGDCRQLDPALLEFLKVRYQYATWSDLAPERQLFSLDHTFFEKTFFEKGLLSPWTLRLPVQEPQFTGAVRAFQSLWVFPGANEELLRLDVFEWKTWQEAREFMLRELGEFHLLQVERLTNPPIGDVSFVEAGDVSILFARSQFVLLVRSAGRKPIPVKQTAIKIEGLLLELASGKDY